MDDTLTKIGHCPTVHSYLATCLFQPNILYSMVHLNAYNLSYSRHPSDLYPSFNRHSMHSYKNSVSPYPSLVLPVLLFMSYRTFLLLLSRLSFHNTLPVLPALPRLTPGPAMTGPYDSLHIIWTTLPIPCFSCSSSLIIYRQPK